MRLAGELAPLGVAGRGILGYLESMETLSGINEGTQANDALAKYPAPRCTPYVRPKNRTLGIAADLILPPKDFSYAGRWKTLLGNRVSIATWNQWRSGNRKAPRWFREMLLRLLDEKAAAIIHVAALIRTELENEKS